MKNDIYYTKSLKNCSCSTKLGQSAMAAGLGSLGWLLGELGWLDMCEFCTICPNQSNSSANLVPSTRISLPLSLSLSRSRSLSLYLSLSRSLSLPLPLSPSLSLSVSLSLLCLSSSSSLVLSSSRPPHFSCFVFLCSLFLITSFYNVVFLCFSSRLLIRSIILCHVLSQNVLLCSIMLCCLLLGSFVQSYVFRCVPALSFRFRSILPYCIIWDSMIFYSPAL